MKPIDFHPDAAAEARVAAAGYEVKQPGLGEDFRDALTDVLSRIRNNPQVFAVEAGGACNWPVGRFACSVIYKELADKIWVAAVAHHSRRPGYWSRRKPLKNEDGPPANGRRGAFRN